MQISKIVSNSFLTLSITFSSLLSADNQTATLSEVITNGQLPYQVVIEQAGFSLPSGLHSYSSAIYKGKWVLLSGRTNGLHDFSNTDDNFPPSFQNTSIYVINPETGSVTVKSLTDPSSGLTQEQIDFLSVTSPQSYNDSKNLYIAGGYGVITESGLFSTKPVLTAIDLKGIIHWVENPSPNETAAQHIRQTVDSTFQVTGGYMTRSNKNLTLLIFGQNFSGFYTDDSNGLYIEQIRRFKINDKSKLSVSLKNPLPPERDPSYRRRDLNVVPITHDLYGTPLPAYVAFSGVFTTTTGVWTVPVLIDYWGNPSMEDPESPTTFKQAMNNYVCPTVSLYSNETKNAYVTFFGGISFGYFQNGVFTTDSEIPFINQVTTITLDKNGIYSQYLMENEYPVILSTGSNPGNQLLFGAGANFFPVENLPTYQNGVIKLDKLGLEPIVIGYIVGGIMSTLPNTNVPSDSAASPYIFTVTLQPTP